MSPLAQEPEWRWRQLVRSGTFWLIVGIFGLAGLSMSGMPLHTYPFLTDQNIVPAVAAAMVSTISLTGLALRPLWGFILERWHLRHAAMLTFGTLGLGIGGLLISASVPVLFLMMVVRGIPMGGLSALGPMFWGHYYGRRSLGQVLGLAHLVGLPFSVMGPLLAAWMFDRLHSYTMVFLLFAALCLVSAALAFLVRARPAARAAVESPEAVA